jgi:hypothetical protein
VEKNTPMLIPLVPFLLLHREKKDLERDREGKHASYDGGGGGVAGEKEDIWFFKK